MRRNIWTTGLCVMGLAWAALAQEGTGETSPASQEEIERLREVIMEEQQIIAECMKRIDKLEATKASQDKAGINNVKLFGDFRYRYDYIHQDPERLVNGVRAPFVGPDTESSRGRHRLRLRLGAQYIVNDEISVTAQVGTAMGGDNVSYNQTLTGGYSKKDLWLDLAYFEYKPLKAAGLTLQGGKIKVPYYTPCKTQLVWDHDLTPEGLALSYLREDFDPWTFNAVAGYFIVDERSVDYDAQMFGLQGTVKYNLMDEGRASIMGGLSYYDYLNTEGYPPFFNNTDNFSNSLNLAVLSGLTNSGFYANDFNLIEGLTELTFPLGSLPVTAFGNYVINTEADDEYYDTDRGEDGWALGMQLGKCVTPQSWSMRYEYRVVGRNAVIGAFTDSDFGAGGTNAKGHIVSADYMAFKNTRLALTYFINDTEGSDWIRLIPTWGGREKVDGKYQRLQLDANFKF
ncbi:MAG: hypothetical protein QG656_2074 [Candidatus Hydrogenedentes bacterium]|nr:hypothetical protein [Candidatus Hydrogenedentota bacterium]